MLDVEIFKAVVGQENVEFLVNGKKGFVEINSSGVKILDEDKELVESLDDIQLGNVKINEDTVTLQISETCTLEAREVAPVSF